MFMGRKIFACISQKTFKLSQKIRIARENPTCRRLRMSSRQAYVAPLFEQVARMILCNHTGSKRVGWCHHHHGKLSRRPLSIICNRDNCFILVTGSLEHSHQPSHAPNSDRGWGGLWRPISRQVAASPKGRKLRNLQLEYSFVNFVR